jgi:hypothetical protein
MKKNWTKREITYYGEPTVDIKIAVYDYDTHLTPSELKDCADQLADNAMLSLKGARYINAPLSRVHVKRNAK